MMTQREKKEAFIKELARYLVADQAKRSIELQMGKADAQQWANIRALTPLHGYPTVEEAEEQLKMWLLG